MFARTTKLSGWSFRVTATMLVLMVPPFFVGRFLQLFPHAANVSLAVFGISASLALLVGMIAVIWDR